MRASFPRSDPRSEIIAAAAILAVAAFFASLLATSWEVYPLPAGYSDVSAARREATQTAVMPTLEAAYQEYRRALQTPGVTPTVPPKLKDLSEGLENLVPGGGPLTLQPCAPGERPGEDLCLFPYRSQAIGQLQTGARIAAFCFLDMPERPGVPVTPTPLPPDWPPVPYELRVGDASYGVAPVYLDSRTSPPLVISLVWDPRRVSERDHTNLWGGMGYWLLNKKFDYEAYCRSLTASKK